MHVPKIAVVIPVRSSEQFVVDSARAFKGGASYLEARIDFYQKKEFDELFKVMRDISPKLIITLRPRTHGGNFRGSPNQRVEILKLFGEELANSYLDREYDIMHMLRDAPGKRIVSWHDFERTSRAKELVGRFWKMKKYGDIVKIVTTAKTPMDAAEILKIYNKIGKDDLVAFAMGEYGRITRILCAMDYYRAPFTYASLDKAVAPGQFSLKEMREIFRRIC